MIRYIDYFIPGERLRVETVFDLLRDNELPALFSTKEDGISFFRNVTGINEVSYAGVMSETDMLDPLITGLFDSGLVAPFEIDLIVIAGDELNKGSRIANLGHYLQYKYRLEHSDVLTISGNHCSNVEYAISYSEGLLRSGEVKHIVIIAVNKLIRGNERLIGSYAIQGDAAGLVYLNEEKENGIRLRGKYSVTKGILYEADMNNANPMLLCKNYMICVSGLLKKYKLDPAVISDVIVQNANHLLIKECLNTLGFKNEQLFTDNLTRYGHLDCIDFLVNLKSLNERRTSKYTKIISFGTGWAGSYIGLYLEIV